MSLPLSVLDLVPVTTDSTSSDALQRSLTLARTADDLGYQRFWVAEHHNMPAVAATNPAVIISALGAATTSIRVGSGGVMLPNHAPYVVAEQFALLEALYPGRVDLGIGRAPGTDQQTASALRRDPDGLGVEDFPRHVLEVMAWLGDNRLTDPLSARLAATPRASSYPDVWLLGSSGYSAQLAGMLGLRYCYAHHFGSMDPEQVMNAYRGRFEPSPALSEPYAMLATSVLTAPTADEADYLAGPSRVMALALRSGNLGPVVSPEEAASRPLTELDRMMLEQLPATKFVGTPDDVGHRLQALLDKTAVQELMITSTVYDVQDRIRTLQDLAAMDLIAR